MNIHLERYKQQILESGSFNDSLKKGPFGLGNPSKAAWGDEPESAPAPEQGSSQAIDILKDACFSLEPKDQAIVIQALEELLNTRNRFAPVEWVQTFYDAIYDLQDPDQNRPPFDGYDPDSPESLSHMINKKRTS